MSKRLSAYADIESQGANLKPSGGTSRELDAALNNRIRVVVENLERLPIPPARVIRLEGGYSLRMRPFDADGKPRVVFLFIFLGFTILWILVAALYWTVGSSGAPAASVAAGVFIFIFAMMLIVFVMIQRQTPGPR